LVKALPLSGKEVRRPLPLAGEGSVLKKAFSQVGGMRRMREESSPCRKERMNEKGSGPLPKVMDA
jgi:hypothetical protein